MGRFDQRGAWLWWRTHLQLSIDHARKLARHAGINRARYIDKADWFLLKAKHQSVTGFINIYWPTKAKGPWAVERWGFKRVASTLLWFSFWRIMAENRTVLLALDGSSNAEYALNCKYKIALLIFWLVFRARSVREHTGAWIRERCYRTSNWEDSNQFSNAQRCRSVDYSWYDL